MIKRCAAVLLGLMSLSAPLPLDAQEFSGLARLELEGSGLSDSRRGIEITLRLSQGVPYRVFTLDEPERLVLDFREVDWSGVDPALLDQS
jgi:N-acetylmuramoyl-L-alanine amidase